MKSLAIIQKIFKVIEILTRIIFICTDIVAIGSFLTIIIVPFLDNGTKLALEYYCNMTIGEIIVSCSLTALICISLSILAKMTNTYCRHEQKAGTPFTYKGSSEILKLGIVSMALPITVEIIVATCLAIFEDYFLFDINIGYYSDFDVGIGVMLIFASLIFRYGADILNKEKAQSSIIDHKE